MPQLSFNAETGAMEIGEQTISGIRIKNITQVTAYDISDVDGVITHAVTFKNGGTLKATFLNDGKQASMNATGLTSTISDDPDVEGGIIFMYGISS